MRERLLTAGTGAATAFCLAFGGTACLITGMSLDLSLGVLALWCAVWALVGAGLVVWRLTPLLLAGLAAAGTAAWFYGNLLAQAEMLLYTVTDFYHMAYGLGPFYFGTQPPAPNTPYDLALYLLCAALTVAGVVAACRGKAANWAATLCLLPLGACLVVTDTVPALWALFLLLLGFLLLILPQSVRRGNPVQGSRLAAMLALPLALALGILFLAVPQEGYQRQDFNVQVLSPLKQLAKNLIKELRPDLGNVTVPVSPGLEDLEEMDLSLPRLAGNRSGLVLTVTAPQSGPVYLRGASFDIYSGTSWQCSGDDQWESLWPAGGDPLGDVTVQSYQAEPLLYFPYYIAQAGWTQELIQGKMPNTDNLTSYSFPVFQGPEASAQVRNPPGQGSALLSLPDETRQWAEALLEEWKNGDATEESFAELAKENSADTGSAADGGLIEDITSSSGYVETFRDWATDPSRQEGDTGIVQNTGSSIKGYHIMYYIPAKPHWKFTAENALRNQDFSAWNEETTSGYEATNGTGLKFITA